MCIRDRHTPWRRLRRGNQPYAAGGDRPDCPGEGPGGRGARAALELQRRAAPERRRRRVDEGGGEEPDADEARP
eukprot:8142996-Heterocapsa_arctica.AAC.1